MIKITDLKAQYSLLKAGLKVDKVYVQNGKVVMEFKMKDIHKYYKKRKEGELKC